MAISKSRSRRVWFRVMAVLLAWGLLEVCSFAVLNFFHGSMSYVQERLDATAVRDPFIRGPKYSAPMLIHPYVGAVKQPVPESVAADTGSARISDFGFHDSGSPIRKRSSDRVIIAVVGGSVAEQFSINGAAELQRTLARTDEFAGREVQIVRLALDGHKQPQQLMVITWLLSLGAEFDIVVNLDGVNESALPMMDNVPSGVAAGYPRAWHGLLTSVGSSAVLRVVGHATYLRNLQRNSARFFAGRPVRYSPTALVIWSVKHGAMHKRIMADEELVARLLHNDLSYCAKGPPEKFDTVHDVYRHCVQIWTTCSRLLHLQCQANGIRYFHFLQPNPHVPDSKPFDEDEAKIAVNPGSPFHDPIVNCYPQMSESGRSLRDAGVRFHSLADVFADVSTSVYVDDCCHVNQTGDEILARAIADVIIDDRRGN